MTNRSYFSGLNVSYKSWLMSPLAVTTAVSIPFDMLTFFNTAQITRDCLPGAVCSVPCGREAKLPCIKGIVKVRFVNSGAVQVPAHLSSGSLPVWVGIRLLGAQVPRIVDWFRA